MNHQAYRVSPRIGSPLGNGANNVYASEEVTPEPRRRFHSGSFNRPPSILNGLRGLVQRQRSESFGAKLNRPIRPLKKVQVNGCLLESVYDLREEEKEGLTDLYDDEWAFRRPRSNSSDFLILRKTSRPLSVDVVGLVDSQTDPYRQYMKVVDCYELAPTAGNIVCLDKSMKIDKAFEALCEQGVGAGLVWDCDKNDVVSIVTMTDFLMYLEQDDPSTSTQSIADLFVAQQLISVTADTKIFEACEEFCLHRMHRILVREPGTGDILYLLTIKRIIQIIHKQNRSLHFAQWLSSSMQKSNVGTWDKKLITVCSTEMLSVAVKKMLDGRVSSIPVVDNDGKALDVLHKADLAVALREVTEAKSWLASNPVSAALSYRTPTVFLKPTDSVGKVLDALLSTRHTRCVFLLDATNVPIACVSQSDVISHLLYDEMPFNKPKTP